jgi:hypothetical protein
LSGRFLTKAEQVLAESVFGNAISYDDVRLISGKFIFFQPRRVVMAPRGAIHFHPRGESYCEDFCDTHLGQQGLFIHEMTHIWQHQAGINLLLRRHPFCRYSYTIKPGWPLRRYGIEQQAEIVRHYFTLKQGGQVAGAPGISVYKGLLPFEPASRGTHHGL